MDRRSGLRRWVEADDRPIRWLDLEQIDNDPLVLAHAIAAGLTDRSTAAPDVTVAENVRFDDLAELIADPVEPFVLVLDDVHHLNSDESAGLIDLLVEHLPPHSMLILVGRSHRRSESFARHALGLET